MADDPLFGFKPAAPASDPLMGFKPTQAAPPSTAQGWQDYLHSFSQGLTNVTRAATDAPTFGLVDKLFGKQAQDDTAAAHKQMGAWDLPLSLAGGLATGGPELKAASAIGEAAAPYVGKWAGGVLGSGAVGAPAAALGAYGHEAGWTPDPADIVKQAVIGGGIGALSGVPGGVVGRGGTVAPALDEAALRARATQEYAPLDEMVFHGPNQVKPALDAVTNTMTQAEQDLGKSTMAKVNKLADTDLATGSDIQRYQKIFGGLAKTGSDVDKEFAPKFESALEKVMQGDPYGRNLTPGRGMSLMPAGSLGGTGFAPGAAAAARDAGDVFHGRAEDIKRLNVWQQKANVTGGPDVGSQASSYLTSPTGLRYAPPPAAGAAPATAPAYSATNAVAGTAAKQETVPWWVKHFVIAPALGTVANEGYSGLTGQEHSPLEHLGADMAVGGGLALGSMGYSGLTGRLNRLAQQRAMDAARSTLSTGNYQAPLGASAPFRDAVRKLMFGQLGGY